MKLNKRQTEISRLIQRLKQADVKDLAARFNTSAVTVRKDLDHLQRTGILQRVHGGAILAENVEKTIPIDQKIGRMREAKEAIAQTAMRYIYNCETVALDAGSTTLALARLLRDTDLTIVTNSLPIAGELSGRESGGMIFLGGVWRRESQCYLGPDTLRMLDRANIDIAFVGASGFAPDSGFTCQNTMESQVKERILARAVRKFIISDSSASGVRAFSTFARLNEVDGLIVDEGLSDAHRAELLAQGLHIIIAKMTKTKDGETQDD